MKYFRIFFNLITLLSLFSFVDHGVAREKESINGLRITMTVQRDQGISGQSTIDGKRYQSDEVLIKFKEGTDRNTVDVIRQRLNLKEIKVIVKPDLYLMKIMDGSSIDNVISRSRDLPEIEYAEPNYIHTIE